MEAAETVARRAAAARVLGIAADASRAEIRRAYRAAVKRTHPDLRPTGGVEEFVRVQAAFEALVGLSPPAAAPTPATTPATTPARTAEAPSAGPGSRLNTPRGKGAPTPSAAPPEQPIARVLVLDPSVRARIERFVSVRMSTARDSYEHAAAGRLDVVA